MTSLLNVRVRYRCCPIGERKCGVMALGRHSDAVALREQVDRWQLGGGRVPNEFEYRYSGVLTNSG
jgi:hypothetical protein